MTHLISAVFLFYFECGARFRGWRDRIILLLILTFSMFIFVELIQNRMSGDISQQASAANTENKDDKESSPVHGFAASAAASETTLLTPVNTYFSEEKILIPESESVSLASN